MRRKERAYAVCSQQVEPSGFRICPTGRIQLNALWPVAAGFRVVHCWQVLLGVRGEGRLQRFYVRALFPCAFWEKRLRCRHTLRYPLQSGSRGTLALPGYPAGSFSGKKIMLKSGSPVVPVVFLLPLCKRLRSLRGMVGKLAAKGRANRPPVRMEEALRAGLQ